jgi:hypothetical protein
MVASLFASKKSEDLKKELEKSENKLETLFKNFVNTQKKFFEEKVLTAENKKIFEEKKSDFLDLAKEYKAK